MTPLIHWINSPEPTFGDCVLINFALWMVIGFAGSFLVGVCV